MRSRVIDIIDKVAFEERIRSRSKALVPDEKTKWKGKEKFRGQRFRFLRVVGGGAIKLGLNKSGFEAILCAFFRYYVE